MMARTKPRPTSVSAPKDAEAATPDELGAEIDAQVNSAIEERVDCNIRVKTYRAGSGERAREIMLLTDGKNIVTLKPAYKGKTARAELMPGFTEEVWKKAASAAYFSLSKSGYQKIEIDAPKEVTIDNAFDVWMACFNNRYDDHKAAKVQFLSLIGAQDDSANFRRLAKKARAHQERDKVAEAETRYAGNASFGLF